MARTFERTSTVPTRYCSPSSIVKVMTKPVRRGIEFGRGADDADVDIAVLQIEPAQQFTVGFEPVLVVDVGALQERQDVGLRGADDVLEAPRRDRRCCRRNRSLLIVVLSPSVISIDQIDAAVRQIDDLRNHRDVVAAAAAIDFDDALHVRLHDAARQRSALLRLDLGLELLVLDPRVALELDAVDDRILDDHDDDAAAGLPDVDLLEQAGPVERLVGFVDLDRRRAGRPGRAGNRSGWSRPRPAGCPGRRYWPRLRIGAGRRQHDWRRAEKQLAEDQPNRAQPPNKPQTQRHALFPLRTRRIPRGSPIRSDPCFYRD